MTEWSYVAPLPSQNRHSRRGGMADERRSSRRPTARFARPGMTAVPRVRGPGPGAGRRSGRVRAGNPRTRASGTRNTARSRCRRTLGTGRTSRRGAAPPRAGPRTRGGGSSVDRVERMTRRRARGVDWMREDLAALAGGVRQTPAARHLVHKRGGSFGRRLVRRHPAREVSDVVSAIAERHRLRRFELVVGGDHVLPFRTPSSRTATSRACAASPWSIPILKATKV